MREMTFLGAGILTRHAAGASAAVVASAHAACIHAGDSGYLFSVGTVASCPMLWEHAGVTSVTSVLSTGGAASGFEAVSAVIGLAAGISSVMRTYAIDFKDEKKAAGAGVSGVTSVSAAGLSSVGMTLADGLL